MKAEAEMDHEHEQIPAWLCERDTYVPPKDNDRFIGGTILSLAAVISRMLGSRHDPAERSRVLPELKIVSLLLVVVLIALSHGFVFLSAVGAVLLVFVACLGPETILRILKGTAGAVILSVFLLLPSLFFFSAPAFWLIVSKVSVSVTAVSLLSATTRRDEITRALKVSFVPDIFILVLDITIRYIVLLGEFSLEMFHALSLRSVGRNRDKHSSLAGIAGSVFLSSRSMADDMYAAMSCRCFTGEYRLRRGLRFGVWDAAFLALDVCAIMLFLSIRGIV